MTMKSVIHIIVDAFCYDSLLRRVGNREVTPFLNKLMKESICFERMYSLAPYTEAAQVSLLSGESTLDNGGYLFGNGTVKESVFSKYRKAGYQTIFSYSPYVYSKAYLRDVDTFYYTRLVSLEPLFMYRLQYYYDIFQKRALTDQEIEVCAILLREAIETWMSQCLHILNNDRSMELIRDWVSDSNFVAEVKATLEVEIDKFNQDSKRYILGIFDSWQNHILRRLNSQYNVRTELRFKDKLLEVFQPSMESYQKKYSKILKRDRMDLQYVLGMIFRNIDGLNDAKNTVYSYRSHWKNTDVQSYLTRINKRAKTEVSINRFFESYEKDLIALDKKDELFYAHIHAQDFHLPSVFHSIDTDDFSMNQDEFSICFELLDAMDNNYRGNIMADLSARYCDRKIELFYKKMKAMLKHEFVFTITADHGFPCYETPPRPKVYNQTYVEAFHIPFIIYDGEHSTRYSGIQSTIDGINAELQCAGVKQKELISERNYVLCEYGGPGCPDIGVKPIWYTYIDARWRVSAECPLTKDFTWDCIKEIYDIEKDPSERRNLQKTHRDSHEVGNCYKAILERHQILQESFSGDKFLCKQLEELQE